MRLAVTPVDSPSEGLAAVKVEDQVRMSTGTSQPALNTALGFGDGGPDGLFGGTAVGIGRGARDVALPFEALAQLVVRPPDVLAEHMAAGGFVLSQVARGALPELEAGFHPAGTVGRSSVRAAGRLR